MAIIGSILITKIGYTKQIINTMKNKVILNISPLRLPWPTQDPFIFCSYHYDSYPGGNENLEPNATLAGRNIGQDFASKDGWNMYHGTSVPGFPAHPHSGFETISIVTKGMVDHSDSLGGSGRFGNGDVQWLTSGKGVQHAEMFPLLNKDKNLFEIFQLWMNLPAKSKKVSPYYKMLWSEDIPAIDEEDNNKNKISINLVAGHYGDKVALNPAPDSWAADPNNHVQIWTIKMDANAEFVIDAISEDVTRSLYFYEGDTICADDEEIQVGHLMELNSKETFKMNNGKSDGSFLFLQGRPINEPLVQYGPFVANSKQEVQEAMDEYRANQFGGWPWPKNDQVHEINKGRFAIFPNGTQDIKQ